jgi:hypothetical protein
MERDLRKVDWSLVVVDTNSIGLARKHHQKLIGTQAVNRRRASREIVAASELSRHVSDLFSRRQLVSVGSAPPVVFQLCNC